MENLSAGTMLIAIAKKYRGKLSATMSLVVAENALLLAYPLFAGFAVDAILGKDAASAMVYAAVVLAFWLVGAARRSLDTRTFTRIYADLAVPVVLSQRSQGQSTSTAAARVVLAREFVDFFEKQIPAISTALVSIVGACAMLLLIEPLIGIACCVALILCATLMPGFGRRNQVLHGRLHDRLEKEIDLVHAMGASTLARHYRVLSRLRIHLSDREAVAFLCVGVLASTLFIVAIACLATADTVSAGHVYAVITYLWTFVSSLDEAPVLLDQLARLRDIGTRVSADLGSAGDARV